MEGVKRIQVMVVDNDPKFRRVLTLLFEATLDMELVAEATDGSEAARLYKEREPDVTLMDIPMPAMSGLDATKAICQDFPQARIILLSAYLSQSSMKKALNTGAVGGLMKPVQLDNLPKAIRNVHVGLRVDGQVH